MSILNAEWDSIKIVIVKTKAIRLEWLSNDSITVLLRDDAIINRVGHCFDWANEGSFMFYVDEFWGVWGALSCALPPSKPYIQMNKPLPTNDHVGKMFLFNSSLIGVKIQRKLSAECFRFYFSFNQILTRIRFRNSQSHFYEGSENVNFKIFWIYNRIYFEHACVCVDLRVEAMKGQFNVIGLNATFPSPFQRWGWKRKMGDKRI